jgi:cellulose synthase/poly-beta-1,6-N-acetylglucosamine synthase-like glycosyltransferase
MIILFHALVLAGINLGSILLAFAIYTLLGQPGSQVLIQGGMAAVFSITVYVAFAWLLEKAGMATWLLKDKRAHLMVYLLAFFAFAIIFVPLHYVSQGYLTGVENILVSWAFMAPVNALALWAAWRLNR